MNEDAIGAKGEAPFTFRSDDDGSEIRVGEEDARRYRELAGWTELDGPGGKAVKSKK